MKNLSSLLKHYIGVFILLFCGGYITAQQVTITITERDSEFQSIKKALLQTYNDEEIANITNLKIKCENSIYLGPDDFSFLNTMSSLTYLDLSEALVESANNKKNNIFPGRLANNTTISQLILPNLLESIDRNALLNSSISGILIIPEGVRSIGRYAFQNTKNLEVIILPTTLDTYIDKVNNIEISTFNGCTNLKQIIFKGNIPSQIGKDAFTPNTDIKIGVPTDYLEAYKASEIFSPYFTPEQFVAYQNITLVNGASSQQGNVAIPGSSVTVKAETILNKTFKEWKSVPEVTFTDINSPTTVFTMPQKDIVITAIYNEDTPKAINIEGGEASINGTKVTEAMVGSIITITANNGDFLNWESEDVTFTTNNNTTTFVMPNNEVNIKANFYVEIGEVVTLTTEKQNISDWFDSETLQSITRLTIISDGAPLNDSDFAIINQMSKLEELNIEKLSNTTIPANAFNGNKTIKTIKLPAQLVNIGGGAFSNCSLEGIIELPASLNNGNVANSRFANTQGIIGFTSKNTSNQNGIKIIDGVVFNYWGTELQLYPCGKMNEEYTIPNPEKSTDNLKIMNSAFADNQYLKRLTLSSQTTALQTAGRYNLIAPGSNNLEAIYVEDGNPTWGSVDGILYEKETKTFVLCPPKFGKEKLIIDGNLINTVALSLAQATTLKSVIFTEGVIEIGSSVFKGLTSLESVEFPASLKTLKGNSFENTSITTAIFKGNNLSTIGGLCFKNAKLEIVDLPASIEDIQNEGFTGNSNLDILICRAENVPTIGKVTFNGVGWRDNKVNTQIYVPANSLNAYKTSNWVNGIAEGYKAFPAENFIAFYNITATAASVQSSIASDISFTNDVVTIEAQIPAGMKFDKWTTTTEGVVFADATNPTTTFIMPASDVEITATYKELGTLENIGDNIDAIFSGKWDESVFNEFVQANAAELTTIDLTDVAELTQVPVIANLNPNCLIYVNEGVTGNEGQNIIIKDGTTYTSDNIILSETSNDIRNNSFNNTHEFTGNISYSRDFSNTAVGKFASICLPFTPINHNELDGLEFEAFDKVTVEGDKASLNFITINTNELEANVPYIVKLTQETGTITFKGSSVPETTIASSPTSEGYTLNGNFRYTDNVTAYYLLQSDGSEFAKGAENSYITAFRAYLSTEDNTIRKLTVTHNDNGGTTELNGQATDKLKIYAVNDVMYIQADNAQSINVYSIDGRIIKVAELAIGENTITGIAKGIYLINNQKVVIK